MNQGNKISSAQCRFLNTNSFETLYEAFVEAFSDYVVPFALTETQFRNHINLTAVDLDRTAGCFDGDRLVAFSLNGFGPWNGRQTVYDAGTGVVPEYRRRGLSRAMFEMMLPIFSGAGAEQFLLEVVTTNTAAIRLYETLEFRRVRKLALLQCDGTIVGRRNNSVEIGELPEPDWDMLSNFWDRPPSWQNSIDAIKRSLALKRMIGAFEDGECVGYIIFSSRFGRVAQIAVNKARRNRGIGTALVMAMQEETADGFSPQVINIDHELTDAISFFRNRGFYERLSQYEMIKEM